MSFKSKQDVRIGDPVEVRLMERPPMTAPFAGYSDGDPPPAVAPISVRWAPATVAYVERDSIGVAFSDGERLAIQKHSDAWRLA